MATTSNQPGRLNEAQLTLLRLFDRNLSEAEIEGIRDRSDARVLVDHLEKKLHQQLTKDIVRKNITDDDLKRVADQSQRTRPNS